MYETIAVPISTVIGAPVSGLLLGLDGAMGLKGWQWLFIIEGIPSIILGIVAWFYLTDRPAKADWLSVEQKAWLSKRLESEIAAKQAAQHLTLGQALAAGLLDAYLQRADTAARVAQLDAAA